MSRQAEIKMVFFDAAGTLFDVRGSVGEIYARAALRYGKQVDPPVIQSAFAHQFRQQPPMAFARDLSFSARLVQEKHWWRNLVQAVFADLGEFPRLADYFEELFDFFRTAAAWELKADAQPTLAAIRQRGLRVGVISNFDARLYDVLRALGLRDFFDSIHISTEVGAAKPAAAIFAAALQDNQLVASQALHVGDSFREDVQGAQAAGLQAVWLNRQSDAALASDLKQVSSLFEILALL